jgi:hypothetical protein
MIKQFYLFAILVFSYSNHSTTKNKLAKAAESIENKKSVYDRSSLFQSSLSQWRLTSRKILLKPSHSHILDGI